MSSPTLAWLFGTWRLMRAEAGLDFAPGVRMEFRPDGELRYHVDVGGRDQVITLRYRLEGPMLHTELDAGAHSMSVRMEAGVGGVLVLDFAGPRAWLVREDEPVIREGRPT
jgi:hypothetical protein